MFTGGKRKHWRFYPQLTTFGVAVGLQNTHDSP